MYQGKRLLVDNTAIVGLDVFRHAVLQNHRCNAYCPCLARANPRETACLHKALWDKGDVGMSSAGALDGYAPLPH